MKKNNNNRRGFLQAFSASALGLGALAAFNPVKIFSKGVSENDMTSKEKLKKQSFTVSIHPSAVKRSK